MSDDETAAYYDRPDVVETWYEARERAVDHACVLAHPERWADSLGELLLARSTDGAVNAVKRGMALFDDGAAES